MKQLLFAAATTTTVLATSLMSAPANAASDYKVYHGSDCKVFGATAWTDLNFTGFGVKNTQTTGRNVICPITKDMEGSVDNSTNFASLHIHFYAGLAGGSVNCTVYSTILEDASSVASNTTGAMTLISGNNYTDLTVPPMAALNSNHEKHYLLCNLGPNVRLTGYYFLENGVAATNTP
jgi:hypothetical protein